MRGLKDHQAATAAGYSPSYFSHLLNGVRSLHPGHIEKIATALRGNASWILSGEGEMEAVLPEADAITPIELQGMGFALIPLYAATAGAGEGKVTLSEAPINLLAFREEWVRGELRRNPSELFLLTVDGDSMFPTLVPGEVVLVDRTARQVSADAIYLVRVYDGITVKRCQWDGDGLHLLSDNPAYKERVIARGELDNGVQILGRVIWGGRRY